MSGADSYGANVFSLFIGALGVLTVIPLVWAGIQSQLPPAKFKKLEQTLVDTETLLRCIIEEGLQLREMPHFEGNLSKFRSSTERIREETYRATTFWQQVGAWSDGLSSRIGFLCDQIQDVRAGICESSAEARARLSAGGDIVPPVRRGLLARLGRSLRRIFAFVYGKKATIDTAATAGSTHNEPAREQAVTLDDACTGAPSMPTRSIEEPMRNDTPTSTARTVPAKKRMRRALHAISRLEPGMIPRRARNAALRKLMQAAKRQRSTLSIAQSSDPDTRRPRKPRGLIVPGGTATRVVLLSQACDSEGESDDDTWEDGLVVLGKNHAIV